MLSSLCASAQFCGLLTQLLEPLASSSSSSSFSLSLSRTRCVICQYFSVFGSSAWRRLSDADDDNDYDDDDEDDDDDDAAADTYNICITHTQFSACSSSNVRMASCILRYSILWVNFFYLNMSRNTYALTSDISVIQLYNLTKQLPLSGSQ